MPKTGRKTKSMRGTVVDFDLLDIKNQMATTPKTTEVQAREDFVDKKLRRRQRVAERAAAAAKVAQEKQGTVEVGVEEKAPDTKEEVRHLAKDLPKEPVAETPVVEEPVVENKHVHNVEAEPAPEKKTTTRKKRTIKKKTSED